jgi:hypothetical protein
MQAGFATDWFQGSGEHTRSFGVGVKIKAEGLLTGVFALVSSEMLSFKYSDPLIRCGGGFGRGKRMSEIGPKSPFRAIEGRSQKAQNMTFSADENGPERPSLK